LPLVEVAAQVGYSDQSHFTSTFSKMTSVTPRRYRNATSMKASRACLEQAKTGTVREVSLRSKSAERSSDSRFPVCIPCRNRALSVSDFALRLCHAPAEETAPMKLNVIASRAPLMSLRYDKA
jgi:hypothetical protein